MFHLLDINVPIALSEPVNDHHAAALRWVEKLKPPALHPVRRRDNAELLQEAVADLPA